MDSRETYLRLVDVERYDDEWRREGEPRWHETPVHDPLVCTCPKCEALHVRRSLRWQPEYASRTWHPGEAEARARLGAGDRSIEALDNLREQVKERDVIEAEVDALVGDHSDVDALASNLPALRVPDERRVFARLVWLVRRWWARGRERRRAQALADERAEAKLVGEMFVGGHRARRSVDPRAVVLPSTPTGVVPAKLVRLGEIERG